MNAFASSLLSSWSGSNAHGARRILAGVSDDQTRAIAQHLANEDPRLARDLRDLIDDSYPYSTLAELDDFHPIGGADDHQTDADSPEYRRPRRLAELRFALDAELGPRFEQ